MQVHHEATRAGAFPLLRPEGAAFTIFLRASARSRLVTGGEDLSIVDLVERDLARMIHVPISGAELRLGLHDRVTLHFGTCSSSCATCGPSRSGGEPRSPSRR